MSPYIEHVDRYLIPIISTEKTVTCTSPNQVTSNAFRFIK